MSDLDAPRTDRERAGAEGFMAALEGKDIELCPYDKADARRAPWLWGWVQGKASGAFIITVRAPTAEDYADLEAMEMEEGDG